MFAIIPISERLFSHLNRRRLVLKNQQSLILPHWRELRDYINPLRGRFEGEKANQRLPDFKKQIRSTAMTARRTLSSGMQAGLTSESRDWFRITTEDQELAGDFRVKAWCDEVHRRMMQVLPGSNFYKAMINLYDEIATFGTGCVFVDSDFENVAHFKSLTTGTYYLGLGEKDKVEVFYRDRTLSAEQLASEYGKDNLPEIVQQSLKERPDNTFEVHHAIELDDSPRPRWRYRSIHWMDVGESNMALRVSGYDSFPVMAPRWDVSEDEIYGFGPGSVALADVKGYQAMARQMLIGVNKQVDPPLQVNSNLKGEKLMTTPGGVTYVDEVGTYAAPLYNLNLPLAELDALLAKAKEDINSDMYVDFFLMLQSSQDRGKTAREVAALQEEKGIVLGPVLENLETELLTPAIERLFKIMEEAGLVPPAPAEVAGKPLKIEYISVLAQAQKLQGLTPIEQLISFTGGFAAVKPDVLDNIDFDEAVRTYSDLLGAPAKILRDPEEVENMRAQAAQAAAQQQQAAELQAAAEQLPNVAQGAKLMSEADAGGNASLESLMAGAGFGGEL